MATSIIGTVKHLPKASVLPSLPEEGISNRIYFVPNKNPTEDNRYSEYLWVKDDDHPEGYWELVGPTTIDLTNYATKEDLNNYLLLTGGNMLDNITFPQEKGIVISGKSDSDLLTATGKSTTLKTINGTTLFGSDNIEIDTSNISVSLEWYKRDSLSEEATINLNIGRSKVNLFPNIFNLFTSGIAHTQTSLYLKLSANPGVSSSPQAPTSLCQWKIPLADNNTAGIISSKDKSKLDSLSDPKNLLAYGVEWDYTNNSPILTRIGNMEYHKTLPIQSALRGCVCQGKRIMYYLDSNDWSKKADGTESRLDGYDGTVQVEVPEFYLWSEIDGNIRRVWISTQKLVPYAVKVPHMLLDAYRSTVLNKVPEDMGYLSTLPVNSAISVVNTSGYCRGGSNDSNKDVYLESDKFRTLLGKPRTNIPRGTFRTYAKNAGKMLLTYEYYKAIFYWLYIIEYGNFNSQLGFNSNLTEEGYRQGGLGNGVTYWSDSEWNNYNSRNPIVPCGYGNEFGNFTGVKNVLIPETIVGDFTVSAKTLQMNRWRGFDTPFGDIWTNLDGILIDTPINASESTPNYVYIINDPNKFTDTLSEAANNADRVIVSGHTSGYITEFSLGEYADIVPVNIGGSSTTYMCDYYWVDYDNTQGTLLVGNSALHGSTAGLAGFRSTDGSGYAYATVGFRCLTLLS